MLILASSADAPVSKIITTTLKWTNLSMLAGMDGTIIRIGVNSVRHVNC